MIRNILRKNNILANGANDDFVGRALGVFEIGAILEDIVDFDWGRANSTGDSFFDFSVNSIEQFVTSSPHIILSFLGSSGTAPVWRFFSSKDEWGAEFIGDGHADSEVQFPSANSTLLSIESAASKEFSDPENSDGGLSLSGMVVEDDRQISSGLWSSDQPDKSTIVVTTTLFAPQTESGAVYSVGPEPNGENQAFEDNLSNSDTRSFSVAASTGPGDVLGSYIDNIKQASDVLGYVSSVLTVVGFRLGKIKNAITQADIDAGMNQLRQKQMRSM